jgi:hypothetical protein
MGSLRDLMRKLPPLGDRLQKKSIEVLFKAISSLVIRDYPKKPGAVIEKLSPQDRRALKYLTSEELGKYRVPDGAMTDWGKEEIRSLLSKFDEKLRRHNGKP